MKKILSVFLALSFLSVLLVGSAFSEPFLRSDKNAVTSDDELKKEESIPDIFDLDETEAHPLEKGDDTDNSGDEIFDKEDDHPFIGYDKEDEKIQHEVEEKEKIIL